METQVVLITHVYAAINQAQAGTCPPAPRRPPPPQRIGLLAREKELYRGEGLFGSLRHACTQFLRSLAVTR